MTRTVCGITLKKTFIVLLAVPVLVFLTGLPGVHVVLQNIVSEYEQVRGRAHHLNLSDATARTTAHIPNLADSTTQKWDVQVNTYMRSGSTFLGKMLGHRNDSFYWYEPLWKSNTWSFFRNDGNVCAYLNTTCRNGSSQELAFNQTQRFLQDIYKCVLSPYSQMVSEGMHPKESFTGQSWEVYRECKKARNSTQQCLALLEGVCQQASHRVTKVLRMDFAYTKHSLLNNPRFKAILLVRDPRGVINSHIQTKWFPKIGGIRQVEEDVKVLCSRILRDINAAKHLMSRFPDRVKIVQYEDLSDADKKLRVLYPFLGMDASSMPNDTKSNNPNTSRNGRDLFSYRTSLNWTTVEVLDKYCSDVYHELGLVKYEDETHLRNLTRSPIINTLPYSLLNHMLK